MVWKNIDTIIENKLYLGNIIAARSTRTLQERRITHVVSVCSDLVPSEAPESGYRHMRISIEDVDYEDLLINLPIACRFIDQAIKSGGVVLVHSVQGNSRGATVVAAYLMQYHRFKVTEALQIVRTARDQIWIKPGFHEQLVLFELCQYSPSHSNGIYANWRSQLTRKLQNEGLL